MCRNIATRLCYTVAIMSYSSALRIVSVHASRAEICRIVMQALQGQPDTMSGLYQSIAIGVAIPRHKPVDAYHDESIMWTVWHHGTAFAVQAVGDARLLDHCSLTDTEYEQLHLTIRRAEAYDQVVAVVAHGTLLSAEQGLPSRHLECAGLVCIPHDN